MIEIEVYAAGVRELDKIMQLDSELGTIQGLRYKIDSNHDLVYMEFEESPAITHQRIRSIFRELDLEARFVGTIPPALFGKTKTQRVELPEES